MEIFKATDLTPKLSTTAKWTGSAEQNELIDAASPARIRASKVTFSAGARTYWHSHPLGQTLHIVSGIGRVQSRGGPLLEVRPGDTVWIAPNEKHWHGAAPHSAMAHFSVLEKTNDKKMSDWFEEVTDEMYQKTPS